MLKKGIWERLGMVVLSCIPTASFPGPGRELFTHGIAHVCEPGGKAASSS